MKKEKKVPVFEDNGCCPITGLKLEGANRDYRVKKNYYERTKKKKP